MSLKAVLGRKLENESLQICSPSIRTNKKPPRVGEGLPRWKNAYTKQQNKTVEGEQQSQKGKNPSPKSCNNPLESLIVTNNSNDLLPNKASIPDTHVDMLGIYSMKTVNPFAAIKKKKKKLYTIQKFLEKILLDRVIAL